MGRLLAVLEPTQQEASIAELLEGFTPDRLRSLFLEYSRATHGGSGGINNPVLLAAVVDVLRRRDPAYLAQNGETLSRLSKYRGPYLRAVATIAQLETGRTRNPKLLNQAIMSALKSGATDAMARWLADNPSYADGLPVSGLPVSKWRKLLQECTSRRSAATWSLSGMRTKCSMPLMVKDIGASASMLLPLWRTVSLPLALLSGFLRPLESEVGSNKLKTSRPKGR